MAIRKEINSTIKEAKAQVHKAIRFEDNVELTVKVYNTDETGEETFDVEIQWLFDGKFEDCVAPETYFTEKDAIKRAKAVLKMVKGWYEYDEEVTVKDGVEVYYA